MDRAICDHSCTDFTEYLMIYSVPTPFSVWAFSEVLTYNRIFDGIKIDWFSTFRRAIRHFSFRIGYISPIRGLNGWKDML